MLEILICLGIALAIFTGLFILVVILTFIKDHKDEEWVNYLKIGFAVVIIIILITLLVYKVRHLDNENTKQETSIKVEDRR